ncbi:hypothetical protein SANTM175S_04171 [Streptomyces antimycoticus]
MGLGIALQAARALLLRTLHDHLDVDRDSALLLERPQGGEMHDHATLAVRGAPPVPAAVALGQLKGGVCQAASSSGGCTS